MELEAGKEYQFTWFGEPQTGIYLQSEGDWYIINCNGKERYISKDKKFTLTNKNMENPFELIMERLDRIERLIQTSSIRELKTEPTNHANKLMNIRQLMDYLPNKPKRATVYQWTHKGLIPFHKQNNKGLLFNKDEIDKWLGLGLDKIK